MIRAYFAVCGCLLVLDVLGSIILGEPPEERQSKFVRWYQRQGSFVRGCVKGAMHAFVAILTVQTGKHTILPIIYSGDIWQYTYLLVNGVIGISLGVSMAKSMTYNDYRVIEE